jgi:aspartokinase/homoserine dehydrogenase 1
MKVLKFGGTSVGSAEAMEQVKSIVKSYTDQNKSLTVISSAMSGITNLLVEMGTKAAHNDETYKTHLLEIEEKHFTATKILISVREQGKTLAKLKKLLNELEDLMHGVFLLRELSPRTMDLLLSFGERMSCTLLADYFIQEGISTEFIDARNLVITDDQFGRARIDRNTTNHNIRKYLSAKEVVYVVTGFISSTAKGETTTLGRGGSDYTASIFGAALDAEEIEIWTDVDGVMTADPRKVKKAFSLKELSYEEAMEMSHFGAKVIYPPTLQPAFHNKIPLRIRNTFNNDFEGTLIHERTTPGDYTIKGISSIEQISLINLQGSGMVGVPGVSSRLFSALAREEINVVLITQASSEHSICFALDPKDAFRAKETIEEVFALEIQAGKIDRVVIENDLSIVAIIGENMRNTPGIAGKMFEAFGKNGINISAIAQGSSELNVSVVIHQYDLAKTLNTLHEVFFLSDIKTLNVFLVGTGLIGGTLLKQISEHNTSLKEEQALKINITGLSNSRKMAFSTDGLDIDQWKNILDSSEQKADMAGFVKQMKALNLSNSVFLDCTSSDHVVGFYKEILDRRISIATPNKLASSGEYDLYRTLKDTAVRNGIKFLFETNVGAGLPVINTLRDLLNSGDKILKIEGVLSGTLSYIFNNFQKGTRFSDIVKGAQERGFTEPDPRDDLNGMDMARKILILTREAGYKIELSEIDIEMLLPDTCMKAESIDAFFEELEKENDHFDKLLEKAENEGKRLRFIAKMENGKARIVLEAVDLENPFYALSGSDNMISITTSRYLERPLVVKGPGAGAEVTAAGVFAEIVSLSHFLG